MRDGFLLLYCAVIGFVAAGIAASFYKMVTSQPARFSLLGPGWLGALSSFFFFALTGPAIVMEMTLQQRKTAGSAGGWLMAGVAVTALWSLCSGIIVLGLVIALRGHVA